MEWNSGQCKAHQKKAGEVRREARKVTTAPLPEPTSTHSEGLPVVRKV